MKTPDSTPKARLSRRVYFSSAHQYYQPQWSEQKNQEIYGDLYSPHGMGHNFALEAYVEGAIDPVTGMIINMADFDQILKEAVKPLDHRFLNKDVPYFFNTVPTLENIAVYCFERISESLKPTSLQLLKVRVYEGDDVWVDYGADL
ncbi:MAG: 6-carboxytetrahydropterin synthase [Pseudobdellovibrionaceae bacterium]|nr:6-carboxytetrahydropterin synthase [Bdellovibrionales bacterium]USN48134.1 MAG: 6-carboxytetrahydropterin synthase [Pseudobdellovibrionaceae bacterium]